MMKLPFTLEEFLDVFKSYNLDIFPLQAVFYLLAIAVIILVIKEKKGYSRIINIVLAGFWLWMGIVYHQVYFAGINPAAYLFGGLFMLQALLFIYYGVIRERLQFHYTSNAAGLTGLFLILFALIIYPVLNFSLDHAYPAMPTFGLPCPTTLFTLGVLLWTDKMVTKTILIIPLLWSLIGFSAAISLGMYEDVSLLLAALITSGIFFFKSGRWHWRSRTAPSLNP